MSASLQKKAPGPVAMIGCGALSEGLALSLVERGVRVAELVVRRRHARARRLAERLHCPLSAMATAELSAPIAWLAVSDAAIAPVAAMLAERGDWRGRVALHSSGALSSRELAPLRAAGAATASLHPMMSFVRGSQPDLRGACFALEGEARAAKACEQIVRRLGGELVRLQSARKAAYHAFGAMLSPMLLAELTAALGVARQAGLDDAQARRMMRPIVAKTISNLLEMGPAAALSGPLKRGDLATTALHLRALKGPERELYRHLAQYAAARLPIAKKAELQKMLSEK